jgi:hypothetical protein
MVQGHQVCLQFCIGQVTFHVIDVQVSGIMVSEEGGQQPGKERNPIQ